MKKLILVSALLTIAAVAPAQAHRATRQHAKPHHAMPLHHRAAVAYPDSVMLEGKEYKVCKPGMQDDCVQPAQAGLGHGNNPANARPHHPKKHP